MKKSTIFFLIMLMQTILRAQSIYVCPDTTHVLEPGEFQVCLHVDEQITEFRGYRVIMSYDDEIMTFVDAEQGEVMDGFGSYWWRVFDEGSDSLHIECMGFGAGLSVDGPGNVLTMTFHSENTGITPLHFKDFTIYDVDGLPMEGLEAYDGAVDIKLPVAIPNNDTSSDMFNVFPNPFRHKTQVHWYQTKPGNTEISLYSIKGIPIEHWTLGTITAGEQIHSIHTDAAPGLYLLTIFYNNNILSKKLVIK